MSINIYTRRLEEDVGKRIKNGRHRKKQREHRKIKGMRESETWRSIWVVLKMSVLFGDPFRVRI